MNVCDEQLLNEGVLDGQKMSTNKNISLERIRNQ